MSELYFSSDRVKLYRGDVLDGLRHLADESVQTVVTSPPYWGLRDYGVEGQLGLEPTPEEYVDRMVEIFAEVRRVLKADGTLWLNMGDSYANDYKWGGATGGKHASALHGSQIGRAKRRTGLKPKDLVGIPWRVAFALQADGWYLRQDIIWHKPNPMPESVRDRCTKAHEYIFLLSKASHYHFDSSAMHEPDSGTDHRRNETPEIERGQPGVSPHRGLRKETGRNGAGRNKRSVWTVPTRPYPGAHFATFPKKLIEPCIKAGARPGDLVLDPFAGSGTALEVAIDNGCRAVGIEINPKYCELIVNRLAQGVFSFGAD